MPSIAPPTPQLSDSQHAPARSESDNSAYGLRVGPIEVATPVVLAPMAGITNAAYRQLCREQAELGVVADVRPAGLFVCEMITSRGIVERDAKTCAMLQFDPGEPVRSVQLYGVDPVVMGRATAILCDEYAVNHVDLNFGCPVPKVTRKGGGAALPYKRDRLRAILRATVAAASPYGVPVTMKTRIGIDDSHQTYLDAGLIAEDAGCAAIALHGRTAQQAYAGKADWDAIAALKASVRIPVLGNGDIWEAADALAMVEQTGVDGVVVGRGCLGRPWLFRDLASAFSAPRSAVSGDVEPALPDLRSVALTVRRHAELLAGLQGEEHGCQDLRKHMAWYLKGFPVGGVLRRSLAMVSTLAELDDLLGQLPGASFPVAELGKPRGRQGSPRGRVALPEGWLDDTTGCDLDLGDAELGISGG